ncbi:hypothetical protein [Scytonema sp. NUACC26]|uniref:hypothetical protein n=1 Tax=Scytonema sp. NUACC26 TaxID=3140176 RepID=UPI0034DC8AEC
MTNINFTRTTGAKDKTPRKKRNWLATGVKVAAGAAAVGAVAGTVYTGKRIGAINKAFKTGNAAAYDEFKKSPGFVKRVYGKGLDVLENMGSSVSRQNEGSPAAAIGKNLRDQVRRTKMKLRKGFLESTQLNQKIDAQRAAIAHTKTGDLAGASDEFKKTIVDKQRKARQQTRTQGDLTRRMHEEVGQYFNTTTGNKSKGRKIDPRILTAAYTTTPKLGQRKKFLGLFNMYFLSDIAEFGRGKDK